MNVPGTPDAPQPASSSGSGSNRTLILVGLLIVVLVGAGAFFAGQSNGESKGKDDVEAQYEPGQPKYDAIYKSGQDAGQATGESEGQAQGETTGKAKGKKVGLEQGKQVGEVTGANDVFDAYPSWEVGSFYIVQIDQGTGGADYALGSRTQMAEGQDYKLCQADPSTICVVNRSGN